MTNQPFKFKRPDINPHDYVQIPGTNRVVISKFEVPGYNNLNWQDTQFKLHENGLFMPETLEFMIHLKNVVDIFNSNGKRKLFDPAGNSVSQDELNDMYLHLTKKHIAVYEPQRADVAGAWTWLDARFVDDNGLKVYSEHRTTINGKDKILKPGKTEPLESCLMEDCYADLNSMNTQGLLTIKNKFGPLTKTEELIQETYTVHFWSPGNGKVANFSFSPGANRPDLFCRANPEYKNPSLGVFAVAEVG